MAFHISILVASLYLVLYCIINPLPSFIQTLTGFSPASVPFVVFSKLALRACEITVINLWESHEPVNILHTEPQENDSVYQECILGLSFSPVPHLTHRADIPLNCSSVQDTIHSKSQGWSFCWISWMLSWKPNCVHPLLVEMPYGGCGI